MDDPRVTVIITNYNRSNLLAEAIASVTSQSFQDYELLIADDGSEDDSLEVIEKFQREFPARIRPLTHPGHSHRGIVATYKLAISKARGEYVAFLEHDDRWSPGYLENKVEILQTHPEVGVVFSPYRIIGSGWFGRDMILRQFLLRMSIDTRKPFDNFSNLLQCNNVATFSCFMTRRSLLDSMPSPPGAILAYDWWMLVNLSAQSLFHYDPSSHTLWRWSKQSAIGRQRFETHRSRGCAFMELMYDQVDQNTHDLGSGKRRTFEDSREHFAYFLSFYKQPSLIRFAKFFVRDPIWAMASAASLVINHLKFK